AKAFDFVRDKLEAIAPTLALPSASSLLRPPRLGGASTRDSKDSISTATITRKTVPEKN
ncbi:unnamed protein product, partial [Amoebophrya sp. A25]